MMKLDCEVIKDLLPLYCEDIASDKSRELVEEHCKECVECSRKMQRMREDDIVIEDNGDGLQRFVKDLKKSFQALLAIYCYTALVIIGVLHGKYGIGPADIMGVIVLYAMILYPIVGLFCNMSIASQKLKVKYVFPIICGLVGMAYQDIILDRAVSIAPFFFIINFVAAMIGFLIGIIKSKRNSENVVRFNEGMLAGITLAVFAIIFVLFVPDAFAIMMTICAGGIAVSVVSFMLKKKNK